MLHVMSPEEVSALIENQFSPLQNRTETVPLSDATGRVLAQDICAAEFVPDFDRSTVDGYAVRARDTFGCTESIPAILPLYREVLMGQGADFPLEPESCCAVPTGGAVPAGADSVVMLEYTEDYGDGTIGILKPTAPGENLIFRGDDVHPGKCILHAGRVLSSQDIGALAAIGRTMVPVVKKLTVGILSTGDELIVPEAVPGAGQIRDVNTPMLAAQLTAFGVRVICYGIFPDEEPLLAAAMQKAAAECDAVLISGGSSVGVKDASCRIISSMGTLLMHGIAMKPGKPTILGKTGDKPLIGLPGHPVAAYFVTRLFVLPLLGRLMGMTMRSFTTTAYLSENISANHGRAQYHGCRLAVENGRQIAYPIRGKSGLITTLAGTDGFFCIPRDCEGLPQGAEIQVTITSGE